MLSRFIYKKIVLSPQPLAFFSKKSKAKLPASHLEPCYYEPIPETIARETFKKFEDESTKVVDRYSLSPHALWITQGKGTERPFTGKYWDNKNLGHYECIVCTSKLFMSDHKFQPPTGIASFWNAVPGSVEFKDDLEGIRSDSTNIISKFVDNEHPRKRVCCSKCSAHLGTLHHDGPPPTFKRYSINSGAMDFIDKAWFHPPQYYRKIRVLEQKKQVEETRVEAHSRHKKVPFDREKFSHVEDSARTNVTTVGEKTKKKTSE